MAQPPKPPDDGHGDPDSEHALPTDETPDSPTPETLSSPDTDEPNVSVDATETSTTPLRLRKTFWLDRGLDDTLRRQAAKAGVPDDEVVRRALRAHYGLDEP